MAKISPMLMIPPIVFAGLAGLFFAGMMRENPGELRSTLIGQTAPELPSLAVPGTESFDPEMVKAGEITLVNFWASWCPPCRAEHPTLLALEAQGVRIVGANFRDIKANAAEYLRDDGNPFIATSFDARGRYAIDWGVTAPPETFIVGPDGKVLNRFIALVGDDFQQRFMPMLEAAQAN